MANKNVFKSAGRVYDGVLATATNLAGGLAYSRSDEEALAQLACTGTFNGTFYASGEQTLESVIAHAKNVRPLALAKLAVYARESAFMKDASAALLALLLTRDSVLFKKAFPRVVDNGKQLRNFCQMVRSGQFGRKSFGSAAKHQVQNWLNARTDAQLLEDSVGNDPSLIDVIKMVHPRPNTKAREAFYAYLLGKPYTASLLPENVRAFEVFKAASPGTRTVPVVPFQLLTALDLSSKEWMEVAKTAKWHMTRMNLNTFERHGVFADPSMVTMVADRLADEKNVRYSKVFPYQLYTAYLCASPTVPVRIKNALQDAMEHATKNVPRIRGKVFVGVDYSGSMKAPVTGNRGSATSVVTCNAVAALMAACVLRSADDCEVYRFDTTAERVVLNSRDSVITNAQKIGANGGGTDCGATLALLNSKNAKGDVVVILSDNESWCNQGYRSTNLQAEWQKFLQRNPKAKLVCIDLAANTTVQAPTQNTNVLNVGGFSDSVFNVVSSFLENDTASGSGNPDYWMTKIESMVSLDAPATAGTTVAVPQGNTAFPAL